MQTILHKTGVLNTPPPAVAPHRPWADRPASVLLLSLLTLVLAVSGVSVHAQDKAPEGGQETVLPATPADKQVPQSPVPPQASESSQPPADLPPPPVRWPRRLVTVTVTDFEGEYIPDLEPQDFSLYVDSVRQKIVYFNTGRREPVSLGLVVDSSGSMRAKKGPARHALQGFIGQIKRGDEVFLEQFSHQLTMLQDFTDSRMLLAQAITQLRPVGGTALHDAIVDGLHRVKRGRHQKKALVLITDGYDTASLTPLDEMLDTARRSGVLIYTIGIGNPWSYLGDRRRIMIGRYAMLPNQGVERVDVKTLQQISTQTGGKHFLLNTASVQGIRATLAQATQTISQELRSQYSIGYAAHEDGEHHRVRVETHRDDVVVRTQQTQIE